MKRQEMMKKMKMPAKSPAAAEAEMDLEGLGSEEEMPMAAQEEMPAGEEEMPEGEEEGMKSPELGKISDDELVQEMKRRGLLEE